MSTIVTNGVPFPIRNHPPGPGPWPLGILHQFQGRPLQKMEELWHEYGDAIRFRALLHFYGYLFFHPDHNKHLLQDNNKNYSKLPHPSMRILTPVVGNGLLTSDGDFWRRQRRLAQPAFHRRRIASFGTTMTDAAQVMVEQWSDGAEIDVAEEMMRLTLEIAGKTLFSIDLTREADTIGEALSAVNAEIGAISSQPFAAERLKIPWWHSSRVIRDNTAVFTEVINNLIADRRRDGTDKEDLLTMLMSARDEETGEAMDDQQLHDELITIMLAGHETTAVALSWTFHLIAEHPDVRRQLESEVGEVLNGRTATMADLPELRFTRMVVEESMRLYPPAYALPRYCHEADTVGGYDVPAGAVLTLSPYLTHRHPDFWPNPLTFDPQRFTPERQAERPRYAYLPFGGGPRLCIGNTFAMTEAILILATIAQRARLDTVPGRLVEIDPLVTLRPKGGLPMDVTVRKQERSVTS